MLIPKYWAQHKQRFDSQLMINKTAKQATIKRYGWSDVSQIEALIHAKARVSEVHNRWLAGEDIVRRERREDYNESNGIPIREQIIFEQTFPLSVSAKTASTQLIVTRNSYGAQVANVDNIAIIDVDNDELLHFCYPEHYDRHGFISNSFVEPSKPSTKWQVWIFILVFILIASVIAWLGLSWLWLLAVMFAATTYLWQQANKKAKARIQKVTDDTASLLPFITDLMQKRVASHRAEQFRLYQTPAGFRIIATHTTILASDSLVAEWFKYFHADANYVCLCQSQQCFRARLTAKPWRMGEVTETGKLYKNIPTKDFWSVPVDNIDDIDTEENQSRYAELDVREKWIADYDGFAQGYRACRHVESFSGRDARYQSEHAAIKAFIDWHDKTCQVDKELPLA